MIRDRHPSLSAALTMLCIAMMLVLSGTSVVQALHHLDHYGDESGKHDHSPFNQITAAFSALDDGNGAGGKDDAANPGHQHHGDGQPNLPLWANAGICIDRNEDRLAVAPEHAASGSPVRGPERPPKHLLASV